MTWISIKDGLPHKDGLTLASNELHIKLAEWTRDDGWMTSREDGAVGIINDTITHWMPLPKLPITK